mgnify:CR=1 FL=1
MWQKMRQMEHNKVIKELNSLTISDKNLPIKHSFIESLNDKGINYLDVYCLVEDKNTNEEKKIRIRIIGSKEFVFSDVDEEEWEEHCVK